MLRLGQVDYLNVLPIYHAFSSGAVPLEAELVAGVPSVLNQKFLTGELDITPISSIAYARQPESAWVLPDISISADGAVESILLFLRCPVEELAGKRIAVTTSSATSVILLRILMNCYYGISCSYHPARPDLKEMLEQYEGALLIGDDALIAREQSSIPYLDLGALWKEMTGLPMVYALWVIRREYVAWNQREISRVVEAFRESRRWGLTNRDEVIRTAIRRYPLPEAVLKNYFETIRYDLDDSYRQAVEVFFDYALQVGALPAPARLKVWGVDE
ncbi:menaquinone biosynthesis protein [Heliorestis acidaminivorans]|uniref:Chorismate dehydratase n=1 Tax=Heliorestis acidaminivorans TaxID=553427 RepID=A0A6I0F0W0_9FIRM|nr:menaquinone biosynthesis protein [Heliorestis acidaminivorans]KAB2954606.1 menaquinone biosynthesis protein [Heliorestis acidaminivorans]